MIKTIRFKGRTLGGCLCKMIIRIGMYNDVPVVAIDKYILEKKRVKTEFSLIYKRKGKYLYHQFMAIKLDTFNAIHDLINK